MTITEKENRLFEEWRKSREGFVSDGVVDEKSYLNSNPKLMFILKEVNDPDGGDWSLCQYLREKGGRPQTWNNITRWIEGIRALPAEIRWDELSEISLEQRRNALQSICAVNLKKSPGGQTTDNQSLWDIATQDKEFFNKQFALYNADITISCGSITTSILCQLLEFDPKPDWMMTTRGVWYLEYEPKKFIIDYAHPQARVAARLLHYGVIDAVREILNGQAN